MVSLTADNQVPLRIDSHGVIRIGDSRVSLDSIVYAYQNGDTAEQIAEDFPTVALADIHTVIGFYLRHQGEVAGYLKEQEVRADEVRREIDPIVTKGNIRQRLLARQAAKENSHAAATE